MTAKTTVNPDFVRVAVLEIERAIRRFPHLDSIYNTLPGLVAPNSLLADVDPVVFQLHCEELLERAAYGGDTRLATDAELLVYLGHMEPSTRPVFRAVLMRLVDRAARDPVLLDEIEKYRREVFTER